MENEPLDAGWMYPRERFNPDRQSPPQPVVYPDEKRPRAVLYGPKGEPLYRPPKPFGYRRDA